MDSVRPQGHDAMQIRDWREFYDSFFIQCTYGVPVPKPTTDQLNLFEAQTGLRLPSSYREFIQTFGPGEFSATLKIAAPGYGFVPHPSGVDLLVTSRSYGWAPEDIATSWASADQRAHLLRLYYFGLEGGRQWLGWDPRDVRDPNAFEYGIYRVEGLGYGTELVATSFRELVEVTAEWLFAPDPEWDEVELGPQRTFYPATWVPAVNAGQT